MAKIGNKSNDPDKLWDLNTQYGSYFMNLLSGINNFWSAANSLKAANDKYKEIDANLNLSVEGKEYLLNLAAEDRAEAGRSVLLALTNIFNQFKISSITAFVTTVDRLIENILKLNTDFERDGYTTVNRLNNILSDTGALAADIAAVGRFPAISVITGAVSIFLTAMGNAKGNDLDKIYSNELWSALGEYFKI